MQKAHTPETMIMDLVSSETRFTRFNEAIKAAGLTERLSSPSINYTVFAPTDDAFGKLPKDKAAELFKPENREQLKKLLLLHVVPNAVKTVDLQKLPAIRTEAGQEIKINVSKDLKEITLANAKVTLPMEETKNGFLYAIDAVLLPAAAAAAKA